MIIDTTDPAAMLWLVFGRNGNRYYDVTRVDSERLEFDRRSIADGTTRTIRCSYVGINLAAHRVDVHELPVMVAPLRCGCAECTRTTTP